MSPITVIPSDTELFPLTLGHNVNLNKLHAVLMVLCKTLDVEDKGGHHSVFGHIPVQKEKYYIIRIKKWLFGNRLLHLYTESYLPMAGK
jgi:hypothetical protein